jgi:rhomboid domain-containing protein 1
MILMLMAQLYQQLERLPVKPPVTIALLAANIVPHVVPNANVLGYYLDDIGDNCLHPQTIVNLFRSGRSWSLNRLVLSGFMHADDHHLYYNMLSLAWKGINLEQSFGSEMFLVITVYSLLASHILVVVVSYCLVEFCRWSLYDASYNVCAVGFSAVLFSYKYIFNSLSSAPNTSNVMGMMVSTKYAAWLELVAIKFLVPNSSFLGHLCGILAGALYVHILGKPLTSFVKAVASGSGVGNPGRYQNARYTYAGGRLG